MKTYLRKKWKELKEEEYRTMNYPAKYATEVVLEFIGITLLIFIGLHLPFFLMLAVVPGLIFLGFAIWYYYFYLPLKFYEEKYGSSGLGDAYKKLES